MNSSTIICQNCGADFTGKYCNNCGEKVYDGHDKSLTHLVEEIFHFFTHFDNKFFRTIKLVVFKPGSLSLQYCNGIRKPFFKPISLFFICVILYLIFPLFKGLNMQLDTYASTKYKYAAIAQPVIKKKLESKSITFEELRQRYNTTSPKFAKVLLLLFLPLSALVLSVLFYKQQRYFFDHFILATELNTFFVFIGYLVLPLLMFLLTLFDRGMIAYFSDGGVVFKIVSAGYLVLTIIAFRRFYKERWVWTTAKAIIFFLAYNFVVKFIYNIVLFLLVMLFI